jgi:rod shape-determining protein MreC
VIIGHGSQQGVQNGSPVVSEDGVIGQVTRVFPMQSEVTLLTDKDQAVPVQIVRTGLRSVIYGTPNGDMLDLRFVPISADVQVGDELVTSGLDSTYPPGLPVAKVVRVDKLADTAFAKVICVPVAAVRGARQVLVLHYVNNLLPRPEDAEPASAPKADTSKVKKAAKPADKSAAVKPADKPADKNAAAKGTAKATDKSTAKPADNGATKGQEKAGAKPGEKSAAAKPAEKPKSSGKLSEKFLEMLNQKRAKAAQSGAGQSSGQGANP